MNILDLSGNQWRVRHALTGKHYPATVPSCIHSDLLQNKLIPDPYYRENESALHWIGKSEWCYSSSFDAPSSILKEHTVLLRCDGLDTIAVITINGTQVGKTDNMFRFYEFNVKALLIPKGNRIDILFKSPVAECLNSLKRVAPTWILPLPHKARRNRGMLRKEQCNYGWDWGPTCISSGIWRPIGILGFSGARILEMNIQQKELTKIAATVDVTLDIERTDRKPIAVDVAITRGRTKVAEARVTMHGKRKKITLTVKDPLLWWPAGMGKQNLYTVTSTLFSKSDERIDQREMRIGFRELKLVRNRDAVGESFGFVANGVPFFAKGANWIPAETFLDRVTEEAYRSILTSAVEANMNMIRVWGGGIYEHDAFYDLCDELGLCVWQDFMFSCSAYPVFDKAFLENVEIEVEQNVKRLRHHACIALWCGNNELEADRSILTDEPIARRMKWKDYSVLFDVLIRNIVTKHAGHIEYWPSSPHSPYGNREDADNQRWGNMHTYDLQEDSVVRTTSPRFVSEFGVVSFPSMKTVREYTLPEDRNIASRVMEHHQRGGDASKMMSALAHWFSVPNGFENTLWLSQVYQGHLVKRAVEHWRRSKPHCMGTLYWQLNDCWPVGSWASIDYRGRWKALHYMARAFYAPLLISGVEDRETSTVEVHISNDTMTAHRGTYRWSLTDPNGKVLRKGQKNIFIKSNLSRKVEVLDFSKETAIVPDLCKEAPFPKENNLLVWFELVIGRSVASRNLVTFSKPKHLALLKPNISRSTIRNSPRSFKVILKTDKPALWVGLELSNTEAKFDDNFFCLEPRKRRTISVNTSTDLSISEFEIQLEIRSLYDSYMAKQ